MFPPFTDWTCTPGDLRASPSGSGFAIFLPRSWNCGPGVAASYWLSSVACSAIGFFCALYLCLGPAILAGIFLSWTKCRISLHGWTENFLWDIFTMALGTRRESFTQF